MNDRCAPGGEAAGFYPRSSAPYGIVIALDDLPGLQTARILWKRKIPVIGIALSLDGYRCRTRSCERVFQADYDSDEFIDLLVSLGPKFSEKAVLFPCSDRSVLLISRRREDLEPWYRIALPSRDTVELLIDKTRFYAFAMKEGLSIPGTFFLRSREDAEEAARRLAFPCILKPPLKSAAWYERAKKRKVLHIARGEDLLTAWDELHDTSELLIAQEWIEGDDSSLYSMNCYYDAGSRPLVTFVARKIRQYPPHTGVSSLGVEVRNDAVLEEALRLFGKVDYHGLGYVEMKRDAVSGKHYIIEPNIGRPTGRSSITEAGGVELLYTEYCDLTGLPLPENRVQKYRGAKWIHIVQDLKSAWYYRQRGELTLADWLRSVRGRKSYAVFSWSDPLPFLLDVGAILRNRTAKLFGKGVPNVNMGAFLARRRIALSWIFAAAYILLARPTPLSVAIGLIPVTAGVLFRTWASGHIRKLKKLATSGPYAHTRNPLYAGSFLIAVGALIMARSLSLALIFLILAVPLYMTVMAREEGALEEAFGEEFRKYRSAVPLFFPRLTPRGDDGGSFDWGLVRKHKEWRLWMGVALATLLLLARSLWQ